MEARCVKVWPFNIATLIYVQVIYQTILNFHGSDKSQEKIESYFCPICKTKFLNKAEVMKCISAHDHKLKLAHINNMDVQIDLIPHTGKVSYCFTE